VRAAIRARLAFLPDLRPHGWREGNEGRLLALRLSALRLPLSFFEEGPFVEHAASLGRASASRGAKPFSLAADTRSGRGGEKIDGDC